MLPVANRAREAAGRTHDAGAAVRRIGRLFRHHRQPGARRRRRHAGGNGGTAILAETPEIYGAEHLLTRRAVSREVGEKLIERIAGGRTTPRATAAR
jgi:hypothetical protein